jgi:hypothetical protein
LDVSPFAVDYWLGHCEGFRVDSCEGRLGFVEAVLGDDETGRPATLLVRGQGPDHLLVAVSVDEIDVFAAHEERIVLRRVPSSKE